MVVAQDSGQFALRCGISCNLRSAQHKQPLRVAIYGAGEAGAQLAAALRLAENHRIVLSTTILRIGVDHQWCNDLFSAGGDENGELIDQVLLAIPSLSRSERRRIVDSLQNFGVPVLQVPSVDDLTSGRARIDALRPIAIEDLLGRDEVPADPQLLGPGIRDAVVCVTGAGGSIGSELCLQILALSPSRLILIERGEPALYAIEQQLRSLVSEGVVLQPVLGSATDPKLLHRLFADMPWILFSMPLLTNMSLWLRPIR